MIGSRCKWWSILPKDHYPEIGFERTLSKLILELITQSRQQPALTVECEQIFSAHLKKDRRSISVTLAGDRRMFVSSFWCRGVLLAHFNTSDLHDLAHAVRFWLVDEFPLQDMKDRLPTLEVSDVAFETEAGRGVAAQWDSLVSGPPWLQPEFIALIRAAANRPLLRQLFPVVSIGRYLLFSRTIGYPFATMDTCVAWARKEGYCVLGSYRRLIGQGAIEQVLDVLERTLPADLGPAIYGTADDLVR